MKNAEKKPLEVLLDVFIGILKTVYHFTEDFSLGVVEMIEDPVAALEVLATMVFNPVDTGYYLGKMVVDSFVRDVIHGDAESRAHWFTYALNTVIGPKAVKQVGKKVDSKAKAGAQKAEQQLDDLLPYHPKHQVALVGPVPYHVFNGGFFVDRLIMMVERLPGSVHGLGVSSTKLGKKIRSRIDSNLIRKYIRDMEGRTGRTFSNAQKKKLKEALRNKKYNKMSPIETARHRAEFDRVKNEIIKDWEENTGQKWPVYSENVISKNTGSVVRKKGDMYDAHHVIENNFGGDHEWWNIHPAKFPNEHQAGIHGKGSPSNLLFRGDKR